MLGLVSVKTSAENGPIQPGDLLTTSATKGHTMRAKVVTMSGIELYATGTILGKALEPLESGAAQVRALVTVR
jgi:hypothetical protein